MATYPNKEFQEIYDNIYASMGDDDTLKANLEAALRPMYEQSVAQLQQQRIANNAAIDVDAASRGMGNSTWVTDAKLRQLRGESDQLASLNANYNNQLYSALLDAIKDRDDNAYNRALQMYNLNHRGGSGSGSSGVPDWFQKYLDSLNKTPDVTYRSDNNQRVFNRDVNKPGALPNSPIKPNQYITMK